MTCSFWEQMVVHESWWKVDKTNDSRLVDWDCQSVLQVINFSIA